jgi:hypothetical protein
VNGVAFAGWVFCAEPVRKNNQRIIGSMRKAKGINMRRKDAI